MVTYVKDEESLSSFFEDYALKTAIQEANEISINFDKEDGYVCAVVVKKETPSRMININLEVK